MGNKHNHFDVAIVGAGIVGVSMAYSFARAGKQVALFEKESQCQGASTRNFGMIWPIGQSMGNFGLALRSAQIWQEIAQEAGFWMENKGSLHLAYQVDEWAVLEEFHTLYGNSYCTKLLSNGQIESKSTHVKKDGLKGALFSPNELNVDPREALPKIVNMLCAKYDVKLIPNSLILEINGSVISTHHEFWKAERIIICCGHEYNQLFPYLSKRWPLIKCKLQMLRLKPRAPINGLGPNLAAGLTLLHYPAFRHCASLERLKKRMNRLQAEYLQHGIHVLVSQTSDGNFVVGDSHQYGVTFDPFLINRVNTLILDYLEGFFPLSNLEVDEMWYGIYAKTTNQESYFFKQLDRNSWILTGLSGAGMTLSFGLAEKLVSELG